MMCFQRKWILVGMVFCFALALIASPAMAGKKVYTIKYASSAPPGSFHVAYAEKFKELVEANSDGALKVNLFVGGQLGSEQDNVQGCSTNMIQMSTMAVNNVTPFAPAVGFMTLPYMFPNIEDAYKLLRDPFMDELNEQIVASANVRAVSWLVGGYRVLTNGKKEVLTPADLKGLTIRVPKNPIMIETDKAWGVDPVPMAWTELFNALQQGVVDGQDNPHVVNTASKFYEVQKYITDIHYILWTGPCIISEAFYQSLPADLQTVVMKAAKEAAEYEWKWVAEQDAKALQECVDNGMKFSKPANNEKEWIEKGRSVWPKFYESVGGKDTVDKILTILE
jgi:tripartite ATP-independent transporter DctP family solute receptor